MAPAPRCVECGREAADAKGWKADIADNSRDDEPAEVVVFCPRVLEPGVR